MESSEVKSQKGRWPHSWANDRKRQHTRISDGHGSHRRALFSPTRFASLGFDFGHEPLSLNPLSSSHRYIAIREGELRAAITSAIGPRDDDNANITLQTCGLRAHAHAANAEGTNQCNRHVLAAVLRCATRLSSTLHISSPNLTTQRIELHFLGTGGAPMLSESEVFGKHDCSFRPALQGQRNFYADQSWTPVSGRLKAESQLKR
jgi:hypothetical protein